MRALEKDRTRRYQTADEFAEALDELELAVAPSGAGRRRGGAGAQRLWARLRAVGARAAGAVRRACRPELRRWSPVAGVLGVVLLLVIVPSLCYRASQVASAPPPPRRWRPPLQVPLQQADEALASGRFAEARARLLQLLSRFPRRGAGALPARPPGVRREAPVAGPGAPTARRCDLDPGLRGDAALLLNIRALLADRDRKLASAALTLMAERIGAPAAVGPGRDRHRGPAGRVAGGGARRLREGRLRRASWTWSRATPSTWRQARTCEEKREAVRRLAATGDPRAADRLRKARGVRGPLGGILGGGNDCVRKDIEAALKELGG